MVLDPKTARTLNRKKSKNKLCSSRTELNRMFARVKSSVFSRCLKVLRVAVGLNTTLHVFQ